MKVLQICSKPPLPEVDGGSKAINAFTQGLIDNNIDLKVLTISTDKHPVLNKFLSAEYIKKTNIEHVFVDTKVKVIDALINLTSSKSYNVERFYNKEFEQLIIKTINASKFDVVLLESLYVSKYVDAIRKNSSVKIIYRAHNIESEIWERNALEESGVKKKYIKYLAKKLAKYEKECLNSFDSIAAITQRDKEKLQEMGCIVPVEVFPFGIDLPAYSFKKPVGGKKVFHIGSMEWIPNQTGIKWLLDKVWSEVVTKRPSTQLNLAGRNMPKWIKSNKDENISVFGEVENAIDFINENNIMVVPLFSASGMRIKIIEAMALGKLVIATSIAAEGINYAHKKNIIIVDTAKEMREAIVYYVNNEDEQVSIGKSARELIENDYNNKIVVVNLISFFKQTLK